LERDATASIHTASCSFEEEGPFEQRAPWTIHWSLNENSEPFPKVLSAGRKAKPAIDLPLEGPMAG
jgi:hypothetical protein